MNARLTLALLALGHLGRIPRPEPRQLTTADAARSGEGPSPRNEVSDRIADLARRWIRERSSPYSATTKRPLSFFGSRQQ